MICPTCHGRNVYYNNLLQDVLPCVDCNGSGLAYCCEGLTHGVNTMLTRVDYWHDKDTPDNTGWYICRYGTVDDMLAKSPEDVIGPYETETEAKRVLAETTDLDKEENVSTRRKQPYDPASDPTPAALDAGIPTDNDESV